MSQLVLATALELARFHGPRLAALYLIDEGVAIDVALEVLAQYGPIIEVDAYPS